MEACESKSGVVWGETLLFLILFFSLRAETFHALTYQSMRFYLPGRILHKRILSRREIFILFAKHVAVQPQNWLLTEQYFVINSKIYQNMFSKLAFETIFRENIW